MSPGHGEKRSRKAEAFIVELMRHRTIESAAKAAGIAPITGRRWLKDPEFQRQFKEMRHHAVSTESVLVLRQIAVLGENEGARVAAARIILEQSLRWLELESIEERLRKLEGQSGQMD